MTEQITQNLLRVYLIKPMMMMKYILMIRISNE